MSKDPVDKEYKSDVSKYIDRLDAAIKGGPEEIMRWQMGYDPTFATKNDRKAVEKKLSDAGYKEHVGAEGDHWPEAKKSGKEAMERFIIGQGMQGHTDSIGSYLPYYKAIQVQADMHEHLNRLDAAIKGGPEDIMKWQIKYKKLFKLNDSNERNLDLKNTVYSKNEYLTDSFETVKTKLSKAGYEAHEDLRGGAEAKRAGTEAYGRWIIGQGMLRSNSLDVKDYIKDYRAMADIDKYRAKDDKPPAKGRDKANPTSEPAKISGKDPVDVDIKLVRAFAQYDNSQAMTSHGSILNQAVGKSPERIAAVDAAIKAFYNSPEITRLDRGSPYIADKDLPKSVVLDRSTRDTLLEMRQDITQRIIPERERYFQKQPEKDYDGKSGARLQESDKHSELNDWRDKIKDTKNSEKFPDKDPSKKRVSKAAFDDAASPESAKKSGKAGPAETVSSAAEHARGGKAGGKAGGIAGALVLGALAAGEASAASDATPGKVLNAAIDSGVPGWVAANKGESCKAFGQVAGYIASGAVAVAATPPLVTAALGVTAASGPLAPVVGPAAAVGATAALTGAVVATNSTVSTTAEAACNTVTKVFKPSGNPKV